MFVISAYPSPAWQVQLHVSQTWRELLWPWIKLPSLDWWSWGTCSTEWTNDSTELNLAGVPRRKSPFKGWISPWTSKGLPHHAMDIFETVKPKGRPAWQQQVHTWGRRRGHPCYPGSELSVTGWPWRWQANWHILLEVYNLEIWASHLTLHLESTAEATSEMDFYKKKNGVDITRN